MSPPVRTMDGPLRHRLAPAAAIAAALLVHGLASAGGEPFFRGDETRHVMTGVFFRDLFLDAPIGNLRAYAVRYYLQYPAVSLLVWPPLFHAVEGLWFLVFGVSYLAAKALVLVFAGLACLYTYRLARRTHGPEIAFWTVLLFALAPVVLKHARQVMLEAPTLALALAAAYHFLRYLDRERPRDILLSALSSAGAALIRYDVVFLLLFFAGGLLATRKWRLLMRREVVLSAALALVLVAPVYALTVREIGWSRLFVKAAEEETAGRPSVFLAPSSFLYYPVEQVRSLGWFALLSAVVGMGGSVLGEKLHRSWPHFLLIAAVYLTFSSAGKLAGRHGIYMVPALALFAAEGIAFLSDWLRLGRLRLGRLRWAVFGAALAGTAWAALEPAPYLRGYEAAARYVREQSRVSPFCLFDGGLEGDFIYQMRLGDPGRRFWTLRGDKLLYDVLVTPEGGYREYAAGKEEVIETILRHNPELLLVEEPRVFFDTPAARRLRDVLRSHPEIFEREAVFPIESNDPRLRVQVLVYRNRRVVPESPKAIELRMLRTGGSLKADLSP